LSEKMTGDGGKIYVNERYIYRTWDYRNKISGCGLSSSSFRTEFNGKPLWTWKLTYGYHIRNNASWPAWLPSDCQEDSRVLMIYHGMTPHWVESTSVKLIKMFNTLEDVTVWLPRNVGKELPLLAVQQPRRAQFWSTSRRKPESR
jgi:hypothetical protein